MKTEMQNGSGLLSPALSSLRREGEEVAGCPGDLAQAIPQWRDRVLAYGHQEPEIRFRSDGWGS